jgi:hypothetical protein
MQVGHHATSEMWPKAEVLADKCHNPTLHSRVIGMPFIVAPQSDYVSNAVTKHLCELHRDVQ